MASAVRYASMSKKILYVCEICQTVLEEHHCKAICPNCGRTCDCSDLPVMQANAFYDEAGELHARKGSEQDFVPPAMEKARPEKTEAPEGGVDNLP